MVLRVLGAVVNLIQRQLNTANLSASVILVLNVLLHHLTEINHVVPVSGVDGANIAVARVLEVVLVVRLNDIGSSRIVVEPSVIKILPELRSKSTKGKR